MCAGASQIFLFLIICVCATHLDLKAAISPVALAAVIWQIDRPGQSQANGAAASYCCGIGLARARARAVAATCLRLALAHYITLSMV